MKKYRVNEGESMWKVSKYTGVGLNQLMAANPQVADPNLLEPGSLLWIPEVGPRAEVSPKPAVSPAPVSANSASMHTHEESMSADELPHHVVAAQSPDKSPLYFGFVWPHYVHVEQSWESVCKTYGIDMHHLKVMNPHHAADVLEEGTIVYVPSAYAKRPMGKRTRAHKHASQKMVDGSTGTKPKTHTLPETPGFPKVMDMSMNAIPGALPPSPLEPFGQHAHIPYRAATPMGPYAYFADPSAGHQPLPAGAWDWRTPYGFHYQPEMVGAPGASYGQSGHREAMWSHYGHVMSPWYRDTDESSSWEGSSSVSIHS